MPPPARQRSRRNVALVLAGGGARGAYEIGALSVLLPRLEERGERPDIILGTSVGALNAAYLAAAAGEPVARVVEQGVRIWQEVRFDDVLRSLLSADELTQLAGGVGEFVGIPGARLWSVLDPAPLGPTLRRLIAFDQIRRNIAAGALKAAAVVTTSARSGRTVVFHDGGGRIKADRGRGIDYIAAALGDEHVRASAAIPVFFPAVRVLKPRPAAGWYFDGGTRLNTPIKPALALGAERVIVIALNSLAPAPPALASAKRADAFDGASELLQAVLVDPLIHDVRTLAKLNSLLENHDPAGVAGRKAKRVPYIVIAPRTRNAIGERAANLYRKRYSGLWGARRSPNLALLGRILDAGLGPVRGELFSYLFFAPEFAGELIELGRDDARRWLSRKHDDGPWRLRPLPASRQI
jgi:NTE family protein